MRMIKTLHAVTAGLAIAGAAIAVPMLGSAPAQARGQVERDATAAASSSCTSYEKADDGSWRAIPCESAGPASMPARRNAGDSADASR